MKQVKKGSERWGLLGNQTEGGGESEAFGELGAGSVKWLSGEGGWRPNEIVIDVWPLLDPRIRNSSVFPLAAFLR